MLSVAWKVWRTRSLHHAISAASRSARLAPAVARRRERRRAAQHPREGVVEAPGGELDADGPGRAAVDGAHALGDLDQRSRRIEADRADRHADRRRSGRSATATKLAGRSRFESGASRWSFTSTRPARFEPARHELGGEAEPEQAELLLHPGVVVGQEIDEHDPAAGPHDARHLAHRPLGLFEGVEHHVREGGVDARVRERQRVGVAGLELDPASRAARFERPFLAGGLEHRLGAVDADDVEALARELEGEHTGSGADVGDAERRSARAP